MNSPEKLEQRIAQLEAENVRLRQESTELRKEVEELRRLLKAIVEPEKTLPSFVKENTHHRNKRPGREEGHEGASRPMPDQIDETTKAEICSCPDCSGKVTLIGSRDRIVEDVIPAKVKVTNVKVGRYWCKSCNKIVEAPVTFAFSGCRFGIRLYLLVTFLRIGLGMPMGKIQTLLRISYGMQISKGGISQMLARTALEFGAHYAQLIQDLRNSPYANCDETGWRIDGKNAWLWDFIGRMVAVYTIDRSRGRNVPKKILGKDYGGTVGSDFWSAYNFASDSQQKCHVHLKRNLRDTAKKKHHRSSFHPFKKKLKRILDDSIRLLEREPNLARRQKGKEELEARILALCNRGWADKDCKRLIKRLRRHATDLFTFLVKEGVTPDNNPAERGIRPAVVMRKNSYGNRSKKGAKTTAILLSTVETCKMREQNFLDWGQQYFEEKLSSGTSDR